MSEPMNDAELIALCIEYGDDGAADAAEARFKLLRSRLEAAEAVCGYASSHKYNCGIWASGKARDSEYCTCGLKAAYDKWQALLSKPEPKS